MLLYWNEKEGERERKREGSSWNTDVNDTFVSRTEWKLGKVKEANGQFTLPALHSSNSMPRIVQKLL